MVPKREALLFPEQRSAIVREATRYHPWRRQAACKTNNAIQAALRIKANTAALGRHMVRRAPKKTRGFAWTRIVSDHSVTYRLTRGDANGCLHAEQRMFAAESDRRDIARAINAARHRLRDTVDELSLQQLGVLECQG